MVSEKETRLTDNAPKQRPDRWLPQAMPDLTSQLAGFPAVDQAALIDFLRPRVADYHARRASAAAAPGRDDELQYLGQLQAQASTLAELLAPAAVPPAARHHLTRAAVRLGCSWATDRPALRAQLRRVEAMAHLSADGVRELFDGEPLKKRSSWLVDRLLYETEQFLRPLMPARQKSRALMLAANCLRECGVSLPAAEEGEDTKALRRAAARGAKTG